jgi:hypothetical protein
MRIFLSALASIFALGTLCSQAMAQEGEKAPALNPVEVFTCNYLDGKDRGDLDKVITRWNKWADDNYPSPYTAWVMTPAFYGPEITFDVAWLGGWGNYADMGENLNVWQTKGGKMNAEFFNVLSCDTHGSMAVMPMQPPGEPTSSSLVRFMDCKIQEDDGGKDMVAAHREFKDYMRSKGSETAGWLFFPGMGAGKIDYDYKLVLANADHGSLAKDGEIIVNGGGWGKAGKTFDGVVADCDSPRLYQADMVRNGAAK